MELGPPNVSIRPTQLGGRRSSSNPHTSLLRQRAHRVVSVLGRFSIDVRFLLFFYGSDRACQVLLFAHFLPLFALFGSTKQHRFRCLCATGLLALSCL